MNLGISNLQHLNLQGNDPETYADNLRWLSGLSSPEFLWPLAKPLIGLRL